VYTAILNSIAETLMNNNDYDYLHDLSHVTKIKLKKQCDRSVDFFTEFHGLKKTSHLLIVVNIQSVQVFRPQWNRVRMNYHNHQGVKSDFSVNVYPSMELHATKKNSFLLICEDKNIDGVWRSESVPDEE
jgi:hypothetical protein